MILGGGPNRIGQGIEFDYCCVHAAQALTELGLRDHHRELQPRDRLRPTTTPPTSSTLSLSRSRTCMDIYDKEKPLGVIAQFGGQTPVNLAAELERPPARPYPGNLRPTPSTSPRTATSFGALLKSSGIAHAGLRRRGHLWTRPSAIAHRIGYPAARPPHLRARRPRHGRRLRRCVTLRELHGRPAIGATPERPTLIDLDPLQDLPWSSCDDGRPRRRRPSAYVPTVLAAHRAGRHPLR